ncbi:exodeoxyribonuclease VII large subunit [Faecalibaculum rodentium]|jgi:exodeoxyribonuclease VII large subunit|uniref:Exodeoxyribonuclease 7 large subunit n=1 Tax=Faecalibaculum rodentium TaxID=1702221 RepID=A0A1Q9YKH3_9FIRM|nr:exodeoxyribonuclease VII large subunit [Faecalibaculum rodentium]OLU45142.1 exodeoxyribonuclease VII large subunit [Faecalibaculum rodentium]
MSEQLVVPVSALVIRIKTCLQQNLRLDGVWIQGEISNLTRHRSGHYYFSIKDAASELTCVMFRSYVQKMNFRLEEGMSVLASGDVNVYEQRGSLQFYVRALKPDGVGELYLELERRKKKLEAEGIFSLNKRPKPRGIQKIGIITAKEGAALQDVRRTIASRWPMAELFLFPATVQGKQAPASILKALDQADDAGLDAILLVRGGGSFEDLFCFNDENIARRLAHMKTYTVTGVGHEVDTTLADFAADQRTATPTAAAQWITPDQKEVWQWFEQKRAQLIQSMNARMDQAAARLLQYQSNPYLADPLSWAQKKELELAAVSTRLKSAQASFAAAQQNRLASLRLQLNRQSPQARIQVELVRLGQLDQMLGQSMQEFARGQRDRLCRNASLLDAYSPLKVLSRGYALVSAEGQLVHSTADIQAGALVDVRLHDGTLEAQVLKTNQGRSVTGKNDRHDVQEEQ